MGSHEVYLIRVTHELKQNTTTDAHTRGGRYLIKRKILEFSTKRAYLEKCEAVFRFCRIQQLEQQGPSAIDLCPTRRKIHKFMDA